VEGGHQGVVRHGIVLARFHPPGKIEKVAVDQPKLSVYLHR